MRFSPGALFTVRVTLKVFLATAPSNLSTFCGDIFMRTIPHDLSKAFEIIGVKGEVTWKRGQDIAAPPSYRIAYVCQCSFRQVFLTPVTLQDRSIMVGQCPRCKLVHWGEWVSKEEKLPPIRNRY